MKKALLLVVLGIVWSGIVPAGAVVIGFGTPIPDECILSDFNGLDWVYAGPLAPEEWGPEQICLPSYRASEGWRFATAEEWANKPLWTDFIQPGYTPADVPADASWSDHTKYKFASEYWSTFTWVDLNDAADRAHHERLRHRRVAQSLRNLVRPRRFGLADSSRPRRDPARHARHRPGRLDAQTQYTVIPLASIILSGLCDPRTAPLHFKRS